MPQSMRSPVALTYGTKVLKAQHRLSMQSEGGRVRLKAPHQAALTGKAAVRRSERCTIGPTRRSGGTTAEACTPDASRRVE